MSFNATSFILDGVSCEEFGVMMVGSVGSAKSDNVSFSSNTKASVEQIDGRFRTFVYGGVVNTPLSFPIVCCVNEAHADRGGFLDRWDLQRLSAWLTGHKEYRWLQICQPDLQDVRYRCQIDKLKTIEVAGRVIGVEFEVTCDSPYAYLFPKTFEYIVEDANSASFVLYSESSMTENYPPVIEFELAGGIRECSVAVAHSDGTTDELRFTGLPTSTGVITVDCENQVLTDSEGTNLYQYSNFVFPKLSRGDNTIMITGQGSYRFVCEFPVNVGG